MDRTEPPGHYDIPPPPAAPPPGARSVDMRVSKRLLWVGGAAYPLENITRVHTFVLTPRRWEAVRLFLKRLAIILSVAFALTILGGITTLASQDTGGTLVTLVWLGALASIGLSIAELVTVVGAQPQYVLGVETSGPSMAVVTCPQPHYLDQLVGTLVHAIENPGAEFQVRVERLLVNPKNYHFGDNVNMYGGTGNVGMAKA
ncbi:DUF6232 family protein [Streptomyces sp. SID10815]|uniref:DUF6232 family protein n=1 Tax=Streptomyces sp. SID10815 TaxID=2706027 RepID=UPI0013CA9D41|nr:DUF6232 family protein [Streptomyces sp. SID10815]NEA45510.1 hypothetical protein [Streptomyces sp. SID10815]